MVDTKLHTLLAVCEFSSFTKAAEQLSLTQPAVTQHIKQLKKELDVKARFVRALLLLVGLYISYVLLSSLCYYLFDSGMSTSGVNVQKVYQVMTNLPPYITLPVLRVMGPVVEEFIYRLLLINRLSARFGTWQCVLLSSILFGLLHIYGLNDLVNV